MTNEEPGRIVALPKIHDPRGNLTVAEPTGALPFHIGRTYWLYDVPAGESRGGHAHRECMELIVATGGSFRVTLDNGRSRRTYLLNRPYEGLLVPTMTWRTLEDFSAGAVCLVLASHAFSEADYIRVYEDYMAEVCPK